MNQAGFQKTEAIRQAINSEDFKRAIKLASKVEKNDLAQAMMAYALERSNKRDEALEICEKLPKVDERVFIWVTLVYTHAKQFQESVKMLKEKFAQIPKQNFETFMDVGLRCFEL